MWTRNSLASLTKKLGKDIVPFFIALILDQYTTFQVS